MQVVEQCDIEREDLPPFDRIGETQVSKEILVFFYHCLIIFRKEHDPYCSYIFNTRSPS